MSFVLVRFVGHLHINRRIYFTLECEIRQWSFDVEELLSRYSNICIFKKPNQTLVACSSWSPIYFLTKCSFMYSCHLNYYFICIIIIFVLFQYILLNITIFLLRCLHRLYVFVRARNWILMFCTTSSSWVFPVNNFLPVSHCDYYLYDVFCPLNPQW